MGMQEHKANFVVVHCIALLGIIVSLWNFHFSYLESNGWGLPDYHEKQAFLLEKAALLCFMSSQLV